MLFFIRVIFSVYARGIKRLITWYLTFNHVVFNAKSRGIKWLITWYLQLDFPGHQEHSDSSAL